MAVVPEIIVHQSAKKFCYAGPLAEPVFLRCFRCKWWHIKGQRLGEFVVLISPI